MSEAVVGSPLISILLPNLCGGGAERSKLLLGKEFARNGYNVEFVLMEAKGDFLAEARRDFFVVDLAAPRTRNVYFALVRYLRQRRPDLLFAGLWPLTVIAALAARTSCYRGSVIISEHATLSYQYRDWGAIHRVALRASTFVGYRLADARVGVSDGTCRDMANLSAMARDRFTTIYNPIRHAHAPDAAGLDRAATLWNGDGPRVLTVGNLKAIKNQSLLLRAFARVARSNARLMLLGKGECEVVLRSLAVELGIADRVIFAGFQVDPGPFYATADLFVLSSDSEGFGNVIVEALSFGLPVVSTDCPSGPREILQNGVWGRLVPTGDAEALAQAMDEALGEPVDRDALKRRAAEFEPEVAARKYMELTDLL